MFLGGPWKGSYGAGGSEKEPDLSKCLLNHKHQTRALKIGARNEALDYVIARAQLYQNI